MDDLSRFSGSRDRKSEKDPFVAGLKQNLQVLLTLTDGRHLDRRKALLVEASLLETTYDGAPLGSTLTDILRSISSAQGPSHPGVHGYARSFLRKELHRINGPMRGWQGLGAGELGSGKILFGVLTPRQDRQHYVRPLVEIIGQEECHVLTDSSAIARNLPKGATHSSWGATPSIDRLGWRSSVRKPLRAWHETLRGLSREFPFPWGTRTAILDGLICSSFRFLKYVKLMKVLKPKAVLVEYDRHQRAACLVLAARSQGIPTFTLVHGVINGTFGYTPVLAEMVLCWGELQSKKFLRLGTDPHRVSAVGYVEPWPDLAVRGTEVRRQLGAADGTMIALLATAPYGNGLPESLAAVFCRAVSNSPDICGVVRLHPSENLAGYRELQCEFPAVRFSVNAEFSQDEILSAADVVVVHSSGFGTEALARHIPCVVLDVLQYPLGHGEDLIQEGGAPKAENSRELAGILEKLKVDPDYRRVLEEKAGRFVDLTFAARGYEACENIARVITRETRVLPLQNNSQTN